MVNGTHLVLYSKDPEADRAFFRDVLKFHSVDAGHGWLIFGMPPAELGVHPADDGASTATELYLMCDDIKATVKALASQNISCSDLVQARWGTKTTVRLPSGGAIGLYQPSHQRAT
jgi:hypothetical protein